MIKVTCIGGQDILIEQIQYLDIQAGETLAIFLFLLLGEVALADDPAPHIISQTAVTNLT